MSVTLFIHWKFIAEYCIVCTTFQQLTSGEVLCKLRMPLSGHAERVADVFNLEN